MLEHTTMNPSRILSKALVRGRKCAREAIRTPNVRNRRELSSLNRRIRDLDQDSSSSSYIAAAVAAIAAASGALLSASETDASALLSHRIQAMAAGEGSRASQTADAESWEAKNVMLQRMRSAEGRGMNDKYAVEWDTVIGEGAYGSVHPARLRVTGENVRDAWGLSRFLIFSRTRPDLTILRPPILRMRHRSRSRRYRSGSLTRRHLSARRRRCYVFTIAAATRILAASAICTRTIRTFT